MDNRREPLERDAEALEMRGVDLDAHLAARQLHLLVLRRCVVFNIGGAGDGELCEFYFFLVELGRAGGFAADLRERRRRGALQRHADALGVVLGHPRRGEFAVEVGVVSRELRIRRHGIDVGVCDG